jgi:hypothetical protein
MNGDIDLDALCSDMRRKARCSETGAVITKKDLDETIQRQSLSRHNSDNGTNHSTNLSGHRQS